MARRLNAAVAEIGPVEGPSELPDGWRWEPLRAFSDFSSGGKLKLNKSHYVASGFPAYSAAGQDGYVQDFEFEAPAVVLSSIGARCGKCFLAGGKWTSLANVYLIFPDEERALARFLWYYLNDEQRWPRSGSAQPFIKPRDVQALPVPVPPLDIQRRIVARIDELFAELDDGEAALARARADLETYRKSLLKAAVTGELTADWRAANPPTETGERLLQRILADRKARWEADPKNKGKRYKEPSGLDVEGLPELPNGWCWATLEQLAWQSGYGTSAKCDYGAAGEPVLRIPNLRGGGVDVSDLKRASVALQLTEGDYLTPGDLLIVRTNGSKELIGRAGIVEEPFSENTHFASYLIRFRIGGSAELYRWIRLFTDSALFRSKVLGSIGSSAGQYNLSLSKLNEFPVAVPPQAEVGAVLEAVQSAELTLEEDLPSAQLRQSILAAAFRGELVQ